MKVTIEINRPGWSAPARLRRLRPLLLVVALVFAGPVLASDRFSDVPDSNDHHDNITAIADAGITRGCNAEGTQYCPDLVVTRDQMASFVARTAGLGANPPVANADKLDGLDSADFFLGSHGQQAGFVNIDGCGSGELTSYSVTVTRTSHMFGFGTVEGFADISGPHHAIIEVQLIDSEDTVVARAQRGRATGLGNDTSAHAMGALLADGAPYDIAPGTYTVRLMGDNSGACAGFVQYQGIQLSHLLIPRP